MVMNLQSLNEIKSSMSARVLTTDAIRDAISPGASWKSACIVTGRVVTGNRKTALQLSVRSVS